jgi:hypothetical protein
MDSKKYDEMNNLNKSIFALSGTIAEGCIKDEYWKIFGFKSCPKRGKYFDFLVSKDRLKKEDFLLKELLLLSTIDSMRAIRIKISSDQDCKLYIVGLLSMLYKEFAKFHFISERSFLEFFETGVYDYSIHDCLVSFEARVKEALGSELSKALVGGFHFFIGPDASQYKEGIFLNLEVISDYISLDIATDEFIFYSNNHMLKEFNISASEIIRIIDNLNLQFSQVDFN